MSAITRNLSNYSSISLSLFECYQLQDVSKSAFCESTRIVLIIHYLLAYYSVRSTSKSLICTDEFARPYTDWNDIASKDRLSRRQQVICAANDVDGENGRCPDASHSSLQVSSSRSTEASYADAVDVFIVPASSQSLWPLLRKASPIWR